MRDRPCFWLDSTSRREKSLAPTRWHQSSSGANRKVDSDITAGAERKEKARAWPYRGAVASSPSLSQNAPTLTPLRMKLRSRPEYPDPKISFTPFQKPSRSRFGKSRRTVPQPLELTRRGGEEENQIRKSPKKGVQLHRYSRLRIQESHSPFPIAKEGSGGRLVTEQARGSLTPSLSRIRIEAYGDSTALFSLANSPHRKTTPRPPELRA